MTSPTNRIRTLCRNWVLFAQVILISYFGSCARSMVLPKHLPEPLSPAEASEQLSIGDAGLLADGTLTALNVLRDQRWKSECLGPWTGEYRCDSRSVWDPERSGAGLLLRRKVQLPEMAGAGSAPEIWAWFDTRPRRLVCLNLHDYREPLAPESNPERYEPKLSSKQAEEAAWNYVVRFRPEIQGSEWRLERCTPPSLEASQSHWSLHWEQIHHGIRVNRGDVFVMFDEHRGLKSLSLRRLETRGVGKPKWSISREDVESWWGPIHVRWLNHKVLWLGVTENPRAVFMGLFHSGLISGIKSIEPMFSEADDFWERSSARPDDEYHLVSSRLRPAWRLSLSVDEWTIVEVLIDAETGERIGGCIWATL